MSARFSRILAFSTLILFFSLPTLAAEEQPVAAVNPQTIIAVVDVDKILEEAKAAKTVKAQVDEKRKGFLDEVKKAEDSLREQQKAIEKDSKSLSKEELLKKAQEYEKKRMDARKTLQERKAKLDKAYAEAMGMLTKSIYDVCQKIADEKKIDLVITRQNIIVGSMRLDITPEVLTKLNETLPKLDLKVK